MLLFLLSEAKSTWTLLLVLSLTPLKTLTISSANPSQKTTSWVKFWTVNRGKKSLKAVQCSTLYPRKRQHIPWVSEKFFFKTVRFEVNSWQARSIPEPRASVPCKKLTKISSQTGIFVFIFYVAQWSVSVNILRTKLCKVDKNYYNKSYCLPNNYYYSSFKTQCEILKTKSLTIFCII